MAVRRRSEMTRRRRGDDRAAQIRNMCAAATQSSLAADFLAADFIERGVGVQTVARELTDAAADGADAIERDAYPIKAGRSLSDSERRARGLPAHPWSVAARATAERYGPAGWDAGTQALLEEFDRATAALVSSRAASTRDVAARMWMRSARTGVPPERMARRARELRSATGLEIEGDDGRVLAVLNLPGPAAGPRGRGRPGKTIWTTRIVALEQLIRDQGGQTRAHRLTAGVLEYLGPLYVDWTRRELHPDAPLVAHKRTFGALVAAVQDAWDNHARRRRRERDASPGRDFYGRSRR
jgi:hypothetical protein